MRKLTAPYCIFIKVVMWLLTLATLGCATSVPDSPSERDIHEDDAIDTGGYVVEEAEPSLSSQTPTLMTSTSLVSPEAESMQAIQRHCDILDTTIDFPIYCQLNTDASSYELGLWFHHYEGSELYLMMLSHALIAPYCYAINLHEAKGKVVVTLFSTQIQRQYHCQNQMWGDWAPVEERIDSPFFVFMAECHHWSGNTKEPFYCKVDWYEYVPILVFIFNDMKSVSGLNKGQSYEFLNRFCQLGLKEFGDALYLIEVPSFNLAKMAHCGSGAATEWFEMDDETERVKNTEII